MALRLAQNTDDSNDKTIGLYETSRRTDSGLCTSNAVRLKKAQVALIQLFPSKLHRGSLNRPSSVYIVQEELFGMF